MKAMIFAAGRGTRLKPITNTKPKALVEINGVPLLETIIRKLVHSGFDEIIVNVHHFADQVIDFLKQNNNFGIRIEISNESRQLLDTGGGLKKAAWFFNDNQPFLVHNVDIVSDIDLTKMYNSHLKSGALATLAVRNRQTARYLMFKDNMELFGWENFKTGETKHPKPFAGQLIPLAFSGIQVINPEIFELIKQEGVFSIIETYLDLAANHKIMAYRHDETEWLDVGKIEQLNEMAGITIS